MAPSYKLTYFNNKGTAEPIRMIFKVAGIDFEDHRLEWNDAWTTEHKPKYPWGTLPVLQVDDQVLSHSGPIARYLARKFNLAGSTEFEAARCDEMVDSMKDFHGEAVIVFIEMDEDKKSTLLTTFMSEVVPKYLSRFEKVYQMNDGQWLVGGQLTWADIIVVYGFDYVQTFLGQPISLTEYPGLQELKKNVYEVPQIKQWIQTRPAEFAPV